MHLYAQEVWHFIELFCSITFTKFIHYIFHFIIKNKKQDALQTIESNMINLPVSLATSIMNLSFKDHDCVNIATSIVPYLSKITMK